MRKYLFALVILGLASATADARPRLFPRLHARLSGSGREPCQQSSVAQAPPVFNGPVASGVRLVAGQLVSGAQEAGHRITGCANGRCPTR